MRAIARRLAAIPIRWRLALVSAGLTLVILALFAVVIGAFTSQRLREDFDNDLVAEGAALQDRIPPLRFGPFGLPGFAQPGLASVTLEVAASGDAEVRVLSADGRVLAQSREARAVWPLGESVREYGGYRVVTRPIFAGTLAPVAFLQYGKREDSLEATIGRVKVFLALGVLFGSALALLAGLAVARRAMRPVAGLTRAAREIARTRDPGVELAEPRADDEVTELSRTLGEMLQSLDEARTETEGALARQREFVADASHELRTPLTSVLANLELLEAVLEGEDRELAASALRSSRRMRRLVSDLLLLARADTDRPRAPGVVDLAAIVRDAAGEVAPLAADHLLAVARSEGGQPVPLVTGSADELHRLVLNLLENAVTHTPPGTKVNARAAVTAGEVHLEVADDGPGVPAELRGRVFERFVSQRTHEAARPSTGLGLAIVEAVAQRHGGRVELGEPEAGGARFIVRLPLASPERPEGERDVESTDAGQGAEAAGRT